MAIGIRPSRAMPDKGLTNITTAARRCGMLSYQNRRTPTESNSLTEQNAPPHSVRGRRSHRKLSGGSCIDALQMRGKAKQKFQWNLRFHTLSLSSSPRQSITLSRFRSTPRQRACSPSARALRITLAKMPLVLQDSVSNLSESHAPANHRTIQ